MDQQKDTSRIVLNRFSFGLIITISLVLGLGFGLLMHNISTSTPFSNATNTNSSANMSVDLQGINGTYFNEVYKTLIDKFIGDIPDSNKLTYGAIKGLVAALGNQYNSFLTPDEASQYFEARTPNIEGIGVRLVYDGENSKIETTLQGYPAEKSGLKAGDIVMEIDGENVLGQMPDKIAAKVKGEAGTKVTLKVIRKNGDSTETKEYTITREKIQVDNITSKKLDNGIYEISVSQFLDDKPENFNAKWDKVIDSIKADSGLKGIVVDLRNNPGGFVFSVRYALEDFLPKDALIMTEKEKDSNTIAYKVSREGRLLNVPMSVLVNEGSASAAEIFTAAIQDHNRGKIIGMKTVGKGVEQQVITLDDQALLIVVFQQWLTPNNRNITKDSPITPDIIQDLQESDIKAGKDPQMEKAIKEVTKS